MSKRINLPVHVLETAATYITMDHYVNGPSDIASAMREIVKDEQRELFVAFLLTTKHRIKRVHVISIGSLSASIVHPREVFRPAVRYAAAAVVVSHSHPSGDCTPSREDLEFTGRLAKAGELIGIRLLDHVIVGHDFVSLQEEQPDLFE